MIWYDNSGRRFESYPMQSTILIKSMTQITLKDFVFFIFCVLSFITKVYKENITRIKKKIIIYLKLIMTRVMNITLTNIFLTLNLNNK